MPTIGDLQLNISKRAEPSTRTPTELNEAVVDVTVSFTTSVAYNEVGGPWKGTVTLVGVDGSIDDSLVTLASFALPTYKLPNETAPPKFEVREWKFSAGVPESVADEDPSTTNEVVLEDSGWIPGLGPWIDFDGSVRIVEGYPRPDGGPVGGWLIPRTRGYRYYLGYIKREPQDDELAAVVSLTDGGASSIQVRSNEVTISL